MSNVHNPKQHASLSILHSNGFTYEYRLAETADGTYTVEYHRTEAAYRFENSWQPLEYDSLTFDDLAPVITRAAIIALLVGYSSQTVRNNVGAL